ncbi:MAG: ATP-binding protein [Lachnospiraceae bacterium]|nr:ATP-binding protein [Lachnospiraceae bacterium]
MIANPFSPIFGGKPGIFFGREDILQRFDLAMVDAGSDDRTLFVTGTRGSGKTALLEQISMRASGQKKTVIDLGPEDTLAQLIHQLTDFDETTTTIHPQANVSFLGVGGGFSAGSIAKTKHIDRDRLQPLLLAACERAGHGLLITVDEVQKIPLDDMSAICNAFQMASRKGYDILLAVAGLPFAYDRIISHEGCTYLRRAAHEELGLFTWEEASAALTSTFSGIRDLKITQEQIDTLNQTSYGHPYLIQLLGYHLIAFINRSGSAIPCEVTDEMIRHIIPLAQLSYEQRALKPLLEELPETEKSYLRAMSACLDEERLAATSNIAAMLNKSQKSLSRTRADLIKNGIIAAPEQGKVMFCIPYLSAYVLKEETSSNVVDIARKRRV